MRFKDLLFLFFLVPNFLLLPDTAESQTYYPQVRNESWFKVIPLIDESTPEWIKALYLESENFEKIERLKSEFYKTHPFEKNIHTQNYKYWYRQVKNYISDEGIVRMPKPGVEFQNYELKKKQKDSSQKSMMNTWTNIGPNITYKSDGTLNSRPTQANVYCIGVAPSNTSVVYAGMETGGIFKSVDKGLNWTPVSHDYSIGNIQDIKVDPLDPDIVYIARGSEIYKTTNGGTTWTQIYVASDVIEQFYIHTTQTDTLYAATRDGVIKSTDGGSNWTTKYTGYVYDIEAKPGTNDTFYISVNNDIAKRPEIFKSTDSGDTWTLKDSGFYSPTDLGVATVYGCKIGVTPADPDRLYAGIIATGKAGDNGWIGVYYSLDEGDSWQEDSGFDGGPYEPGNDPATNWYVAGYSSGYHQGWYNFDIDVSHSDPDKLWIGTIWFCESDNKGGNIEYIRGTRSLEMHADIQDIDVHGGDIWITSDGGINYSNDECLTVDVRMNGITASDFWGFGHGWNEDVYVGGRYHNGNAAFHEDYGIGNTMFLGGAESATGYVNQLDNRKTYFSDIGDKKIPTSLTQGPSGIPNLGMYPTQSYFHFSYSEVEWDPRFANQVYVGKEQSLFKSIDGGATFDTLHTFPGDVRRFEISRDDPDYIYIIVYHSYWDWRIYRTTDGGATFNEINTPPFSSGSWRNISFTLNPFDKNEIWTASNSSNDGNKIFSSTDGGTNWTNRYTANISGEAIKDIIFQSGTESDKVYAMTNDNFFYYDMAELEWFEYSNGLPVVHTGFMILPFWRDNKIRMASAKGIWEVPFLGTSNIQPQPMVSQDSVFCSRDTVYFDSYSIVDSTGATFDWTITPAPQWISDAGSRNPKVVFGTDGSYDVELKITHNAINYTKSIPGMVNVISFCDPDSTAGQNLKTDANGESVVVQDANLNNITHFTVTGWWKPEGSQEGFAGLWSSGDWCAHCDYTEGLIIDYFGSRVWYKWPGNAANWGSNSGMTIPLDEWSYVALVIEPTKATMYLNDQKYEHNISLNPGDISTYHIGYGHYSKSFKGNIDEVTLWNKALSESDIRRLRHITKEDEIMNDPDLIAYYQLNETVGGSQIMDKAGTRHGILHIDAELEPSTVPVGGGEAQIFDVVNNQYMYDFTDTGTQVFMSDCESVSGDQIVMSRLDVRPDVTANMNANPENYWIINYYGNNGEFPNLDSIILTVTDTGFINNIASPDQLDLHVRSENGEGNMWNVRANATGLSGNTVVFDRNSLLDERTQISITDGSPAYTETDPGKPCFIDTIPLNMISFNGTSSSYASCPHDASLDFGTSQDFSISFWIKTQTVSSDATIIAKKDWDSGFNPGWVISTQSGQLWVNLGDGTNRVDIQPATPINDGEWHYVAVTFARAGQAIIYIDGMLIESDDISDIGNLNNSLEMVIGADSEYDYPIDADIEELCIFNKVLTINEIRSLRHLTKDPASMDIISYYQFNFDNGGIYDKFGSNHLTASINAILLPSDCPFGGGTSSGQIIMSAGTYNYSNENVSIEFPSGITYPNGDVYVTKLNISPDTVLNSSNLFNRYWIINNYGENQTFTSPDILSFSNIPNIEFFEIPGSFLLQQREENASGLSWGNVDNGDNINMATQTLTFDSGLNQTEFGQFFFDNSDGLFWTGIEDTDWDNINNWSNEMLPDSDSEVIIPSGRPHFPVLNIDSQIRTLYIEKGASFFTPLGRLFDVLF